MRIIILTAYLLLSSCASHTAHPWAKAREPRSKSCEVSPKKITNVKTEEIAFAASLLSDREFVSLEKSILTKISDRQLKSSESDSAFLIRGVSWSQPPLFRKVYVEADDKTVNVNSYTYNGEIFIPGNRSSVQSPVIVLLPFTPTNAYCDAVIGGDRIMGMYLHQKVRNEEPKR